MLAPVVMIFLAAADAERPEAAALVAAAVSALDGGARVVVRSYGAVPPGDAALAEAARAQPAAAAARLVWDRPGGTRAALDVYLVEGDRIVHRMLDFQAEDLPVERARALGLVLASLVARPARGTEAGGAPPGAATTAARPAEAPGPSVRPPELPDPAPAGEAVAAAGSPDPATPGRWSLEAFAGGGLALGGAGTGVGGGLAARRYGEGSWGARLGLHARGGSVPAAQATSLALGIAASGFRRLLGSLAISTWDVSLRADLLLMYESLTHLSSDDPSPVRKGGLLPGGAALLEGRWRLTPSLAIHLAAGTEVAFGVTHVVVRGTEVAELAPVRGVLEAGFGASF